MRPSDPVVSIYAVAAQTGSFVVLLATSTNRYYLPRVSTLIDRQDDEMTLRAANARLRQIAPLCAVFLLVVFLFGRRILHLFGSEFVVGHAALCTVAVGATTSTLFALSPYYLQFVGRNLLVNVCTFVAAATSIAICFPLASRLGSLGAGIAYALPMAALYIVLAVVARSRFARTR